MQASVRPLLGLCGLLTIFCEVSVQASRVSVQGFCNGFCEASVGLLCGLSKDFLHVGFCEGFFEGFCETSVQASERLL